MKVFFVVSALLWMTSAAAGFGPWGKDAQLAFRQEEVVSAKPALTPFLGPLADILIDFHHTVISPCDGPRSHFTPSSSYYTQEAIRKYGFFRGVMFGCDRLMRENKEEWVYGKAFNKTGILRKYDPVP